MKIGLVLGWVITVCLAWILQCEAIAAPTVTPDRTPDFTQGATVFEAQCAGCHVGGGNIVRRGKNLKLKTLQKNQVDTVEAIAALVTAGKGNMSAYGDRLSVSDIHNVSAYVLAQAENGWK